MSDREPTGMILLGKGVLDQFTKEHPDANGWIDTWVSDVEGSVWKTPQDIKNKYPSASIISGEVVIFNVKGNHYRLEVKVAYNTVTVLAVWAGTHHEYDRRNKKR